MNPSDLLLVDLPTVREDEARELLGTFERALERAQELEMDLIDARQRVTQARERVLERLGVRL